MTAPTTVHFTCHHCGLVWSEQSYSPATSSWWGTCPRCRTKASGP
jgi:hypothetical protein